MGVLDRLRSLLSNRNEVQQETKIFMPDSILRGTAQSQNAQTKKVTFGYVEFFDEITQEAERINLDNILDNEYEILSDGLNVSILEEQGLKDKISESPNRNPVGNQGNKNFEEELKKAVERRQQTRNEQGLKIENTKSSLNDLRLQAEEKSQKMSKNNEKSKQANERVYGIL